VQVQRLRIVSGGQWCLSAVAASPRLLNSSLESYQGAIVHVLWSARPAQYGAGHAQGHSFHHVHSDCVIRRLGCLRTYVIVLWP
jgi:hypothetical protein